MEKIRLWCMVCLEEIRNSKSHHSQICGWNPEIDSLIHTRCLCFLPMPIQNWTHSTTRWTTSHWTTSSMVMKWHSSSCLLLPLPTLQFRDENDHILKIKLCVSGAGRERKTSNMLRNITLDDVVGKMHSFHWKLMSSKNHHDQRELIYLNEWVAWRDLENASLPRVICSTRSLFLKAFFICPSQKIQLLFGWLRLHK